MTTFNRLTIVAAAEVIASFNANNDMNVLEVQWDIERHISATSKSARIASWSRVATGLDPEVMTEAGKMKLSRAIVELAVQAPDRALREPSWHKFVAGLRFDGFEVVADRVPDPSGVPSLFDSGPGQIEVKVLRKMLPDDIPGLDFRDAESEVERLLRKHDLTVAAAHLDQATSAFQRGDWAASNAQLRNVYQNLLDRIAVKLGCDGSQSDDAKRTYLASELSGPFFLAQYNEWVNDRGRPAFVPGLWARLHPEGSHPGLSEEDDCTFRLQVTLITARLFLRRFDQRISGQ